MNTNILATLTEQSKSLMAPVQKLNHIAIATTEKLVAFQTANLQKYADLGFAQWKAAAEVNDPESFVNFLANQDTRLSQVGEALIADTKRAYPLGVDLLCEAQKMAQENVVSVTKTSKEKAVCRKRLRSV